ncbi:MAG: rod shape-determining protein [Bacilli bacterium]|nr:rod shape-determining protein [Bacilli bacterium]
MFASVDLGSHSIKIIVCRKVDDKYCVLASTCVKSMGIKRGFIKDKEQALNSLKEAINNIEKDLGIKLHKVLLSFPLYNLNTTIESGEIAVSKVVSGEDIREVINKTVKENIDSNSEIVYLEPIVFEVDGGIQVVDPKGLETNNLKARLAVSTIDKSILYEYLELLNEAELSVDDLVYGIVGDYMIGSNRDIERKLGVVVNIGYSKTEIAIINKGILLKGTILPIGSRKIDKDISYVYKLDRETSRELKENFANSSSLYADKNDYLEVTNISGESVNINQFEISQVVEARLEELIKSVKLEINNLTNREISYIIITGGITNMAGFAYLLENEFDEEKIICNVTPMGIRSNIYSTGLGIIECIDKKMKFREIDYNMFGEDEIKKLTAKEKVCRDSLISKLEAYLKD